MDVSPSQLQWTPPPNREVGSNNRVRCLWPGLGGCVRGYLSRRPMDPAGEKTQHQLPRAIGQFPGIEGFHSTEESHLSTSTSEAGQRHSDRLPEQDGGSHSRSLSDLAVHIWTWCLKREITLHAEHLPGIENVEADWLSCHTVDSSDWKLRREIFLLLEDKVIYPFTIDLFTSRTTAQMVPGDRTPSPWQWMPCPSLGGDTLRTPSHRLL